MTRDDIIRIAREAGLSNDFGNFGYPYLPELERFARLVAAAEREACAKVCEEPWQGHPYDIAKQIRARGAP
jgi:hypothetical protein